MKDNLSPPIDTTQYKNAEEVFDEAYKIFQVELNFRQNRPMIFGKFIYIDGTMCQDGKTDGFWHIASIGDNDTKYDMYPCCNDKSSEICKHMCDIDHEDNFLKKSNSIPCVYRAARIVWIKEILELVNKDKNNPYIRIWKQKNQRSNHTHLMIRYVSGTIDYVLIFKVVYRNKDIDQYRLITAYPVVLKSYKARFDKEYDKYKASKK